jgi:hypothetical protein
VWAQTYEAVGLEIKAAGTAIEPAGYRVLMDDFPSRVTPTTGTASRNIDCPRPASGCCTDTATTSGVRTAG